MILEHIYSLNLNSLENLSDISTIKMALLNPLCSVLH